jgi:redox-sensitive bicupin YhaK (pirin superfamily)
VTSVVHAPAASREHERRGWVESWRSFPGRAWRKHGIESPLLLIAEDIVAPGQGFDRHGHRDMEIISYPIAGALAHQDSTGRHGVLRPGEIQQMTAGRGIAHSEVNASSTDPVRFLQIWIIPEHRGLQPGYEQAAFDATAPRVELAGPDGALVKLHQQMRLVRVAPGNGETVNLPLEEGAHAWVHGVRGSSLVQGLTMTAGDGAGFASVPALSIAGLTNAELLVFIQPGA